MDLILLSLLLISSLISCFIYRYLYRLRYLFSDRFGYVATITAASSISLATSLNLALLFPISINIIGVVNIILGMSIGILFGAMMLTAQSMIAGFYNGGIGGIMGTMIGTVAYDPSICGIPISPALEQYTILFFGVFSVIVLILTISLMVYSIRV